MAITDGGTDVVVLVAEAGPGAIGALSEAARQLGCSPRLVLADRAPAPVLAQAAEVTDAVVQVPDVTDPGALAEAATGLAGGRPAALLSWYDGTLVPTARAAELLGLPTAPWRALQRGRHKHAARRALRAAGLAGPRFALLGSAADADRVAAEVGLPAVIKPVNGSASNLVRRVATAAGLAEAYRELADRSGAAMDGLYARPLRDPDTGEELDPTRTFLVEGELTGAEYSADVLVRPDGGVELVTLLDKFLIGDDFFERGFCWPPLDLPAAGQQRIASTVDGAIRALGLRSTTAHVEVLDDPVLGPTVVEVNPGRAGGQLIGMMSVLGTGTDLRAEHLCMALGRPAPPRDAPKLPPPLATMTIFGDRTGRLVRIDGLDELSEHPDVMLVVPAVRPGDQLTTDHETFPLNVLVAGLTTRDQMEEVYRELAATVRFVVEP